MNKLRIIDKQDDTDTSKYEMIEVRKDTGSLNGDLKELRDSMNRLGYELIRPLIPFYEWLARTIDRVMK